MGRKAAEHTWEVIDAEMYAILAYLRKMASASDAQSRRCLVLCDCKPALQQIENAHRKGMPEGLRDWERGGLLEAIAYYRSKLEAVVFMWVPAHVGIACNAYADAVATAYLGNDDTEDASKVVRDAVRTRPCMYTVRREAAENAEKREIVDRRTYGHMCKSAHEWVCEQYRKTVRPGSHTAGVAGRLWSEVAVASLRCHDASEGDPSAGIIREGTSVRRESGPEQRHDWVANDRSGRQKSRPCARRAR